MSAPTVRMITDRQLYKLNILLKECGLIDRPARLKWMGDEVVRDLKSSKELTCTEASMLIQVLEHEKSQRAQKSDEHSKASDDD
ncbi:hypothetical protein [Mycobacteroides franklinii]|uniref:hypothetical protein n=1 Tax=Mycobacteroides franklinii TaxID=948102 RepID=UPI0009937639|nr:hypothetical protein [Mycobacteroides franklinii]ORA64129.1 hypothetical protein BST24_02900 [Mycobacteroides franklinii]